jgi:DNA invertase Pin-like site-specific DNA recombinase
MSGDEAIRAIRSAAKRRERAANARREATDDLRRYCQEAQAAGVPISQIAREAGLSRQGVYDLLGQPPSQRN